MRIGKTIIDTDNMTIDDMGVVIKELKRLRARKIDARFSACQLRDLLADMEKSDYVFCNKHTAEVLRAQDWIVYDNQEKCAYDEAIEYPQE